MTFKKGHKPSPKSHWPKGRRRNPDSGDWETIRLGLRAIIDNHEEAGVISQAALARACGVNSKTVTKWMRGENRPSIESQDVARAWLKEKRAAIKAAAKGRKAAV